MIGLYIKNKNTEKELTTLLSDVGVESYQSGHTYTHLLWFDKNPPPAGIPILSTDSIHLPLTLDSWISFLRKQTQTTSIFDNSIFHFDGQKRLLLNKKTHVAVSLTEKENALLAYLANAPCFTASRQDLLKSVWQYNPQAQTHTLESHIYALKQKIGDNADALLNYQDGQCFLVL